MAVKTFSPVLLLCIAAFSFAAIGSASLKGRPANRPPTKPIDARQFSNVSFPLTQAPPPDPSSTVPDMSPTSTCHTYDCNLFYQWVSIFYWPSESQNTACLASLPSPPPTGIPPGLHMVSPSIYAIFPSIKASDGCKQIGKGYGPITTSFAPGELSTIDNSQSTNVFNFADLPCPPSGIDVPAGSAYGPLISPPSFIKELDPAFASCIPAFQQGVDPATAIPTDNGAQGPGRVGDGRRRRDFEASPWGPTKTAGPNLKVLL